ncbi:MAG: transposase [Thermoplasmata archaeon]|nr:transposase [Thermoplasmata archaeon]
MRLSFRYRLYPLADQIPILHAHRSELHYLWNHALAERCDAWRNEHRAVRYLDQQGDLTRWRAYDSEGLGRLSVAVAQDCLQRLDLAFRAFFRRVRRGERPGYPRFRREVDSFTYTPPRHPLVPSRNGTWRLKVPKVGEIPLRLHRPLPPFAEVRTVTVRYEAGAWFTTLSLEVPDPAPPPREPPIAPAGVDLGLTHLATLSTGEVIEPREFLWRGEDRLRKEQRRLSRKHRGSNRYLRQRVRVARAHAKVRRQRQWFAHQVSHDLAERFDLVAFEDLSAAAMIEGNRHAKGLADAGWGMLRDMKTYKEVLRSGRVFRVPAQGTTQVCSQCGKSADPPIRLHDRAYRCPCGFEGDRDVNAARNVLARGMHLLSEELRRSTAEVTRVESGPPPGLAGRRVYQRRRAGSRKREHGIEVGAPFGRPVWAVRLAVPIP